MKRKGVRSGKLLTLAGSVILVVTAIIFGACSTSPSPTSSPTPTVASTSTPIYSSTPTPTITPTPAGTGQSITIDLVAHDLAFNMTTITVPAGASVTVNFDNQDAGINHNFAVYQNILGGSPQPIFIGQVITGPSQITYHFTAPSASGSYFFECDNHPNFMNGGFEVTP